MLLPTCHVLAEGPIVGEDVDEGERHGEGAEEDVGHCQGRNENVSCCQHHLWFGITFRHMRRCLLSKTNC